MLLLGIEEIETWATRKRTVLDMLENIKEYTDAREEGDGERSKTVNKQLQ
jgi:hypothetical protein